MTITVPINSVTTFREKIDREDKTQQLTALLHAGNKLEPIHVKRFGDAYILFDGRHRMRAHEIAGLASIEAEIIEGEVEFDGIKVLRRGAT